MEIVVTVLEKDQPSSVNTKINAKIVFCIKKDLSNLDLAKKFNIATNSSDEEEKNNGYIFLR